MSPISDKDAWHAAKIMIDRHGDTAAAVAVGAAEQALVESDLEKQAAWLIILSAVEELQRTIPKDGERMN
jgi:hypothetical protein